MAAVASVPVTTTQVAGISFGFYSPDEVKTPTAAGTIEVYPWAAVTGTVT